MDPIPKVAFTRRRFVEVASVSAAATVFDSAASAAESPVSLDEAYPILTPADEFYDVSRGKPIPHTLKGEALKKARLTPETWRLEMVADEGVNPPTVKKATKIENSFTIEDETAINFPALLAMEKASCVKYIKAMQCLNISEPLGQGLWEGILLRDVLRLCGGLENVRRIRFVGFHNKDPKQIFQSSVSYTQAMETAPGELPAFLAYRLNGEPISLERGGPVRLIVPWAHGFKSIKWLQKIILTNDYQNDDTYALKNNHPESFLKTAAYVDGGSGKIKVGEPAIARGQVISGLSGLERVETWLQKTEGEEIPLDGDSPELLAGQWQPAKLQSIPDWKTVLPKGIRPHDLLGFDSKTGKPLSWPLRYGLAAWSATYKKLPPGNYRIYARAVDKNGFAQPEPRSIWKSGDNMVQSHEFEVL